MDWFFFLGLLGIIGITLVYSYFYGITPTPTSGKVKNLLLQMLPEMANKEIAELGSGWGTLAFALAAHFPSCHVMAYEISPFPYLVSKLLAKWFFFPNLFIKRQDFFQVSLRNVSLVVCYLYPGAMQRLKIKFENELASEAYVISHTFAIPGWTPIRFERAQDLYRTPIYLYQIKKVTAGQKPKPKDTGNHPKIITPKQRFDPMRMKIKSLGEQVRSASGMLSIPRVSISSMCLSHTVL